MSQSKTKSRAKKRFFFLLQSFILLLTVAVTPIVHTGCIAVAAVGAGAGAYAYLRGSLDSHLTADFEKCLEAVRRGVPRLGLVKIKEVSDQSNAKFIFRDSFDTKISIHMSERSGGVTEITIRVGQLGDEGRSIQILNQINRELKANSSNGS